MSIQVQCSECSKRFMVNQNSSGELCDECSTCLQCGQDAGVPDACNYYYDESGYFPRCCVTCRNDNWKLDLMEW